MAITVDTLSDEFNGVDVGAGTSLREAIFAAAAGETINFSVTGVIQLSSLGELTINKSLTIHGPGANLLTIRAFDPTPGTKNGDGNRVVNVDNGSATLVDVSLTGVTLSGGDTSFAGGGIFSRENLTLVRSEISGNNASVGGGAYSSNGGHLTVINSTISGNTSRHGGGIYQTSGTLTVRGSTISSNSATTGATGYGGGIYIRSGSTLSLSNTTITGNTALTSHSGIYKGSTVPLTLDHSIIAGNTAPSVPDLPSGEVSSRFSLIGDNSGSGLPPAPVGSPDANGNLIGTAVSPINPMLGALSNNGGSTRTHALLPGSPARNAGDRDAAAGVGDVPQFDQRGAPFARVAGDRIDMGAFEAQIVVDSLADENDADYSPGDLSLREAIGLANADPDLDGITFDPTLFAGGPATISLSLGPLEITRSTVITGPGANRLTIDAQQNSRVFDIDDGDNGNHRDVAISGLTITGGHVSVPGMILGGGGGIRNQEHLTIRATFITGNSVSGNVAIGGGVYSKYGGLAVVNSTITGNSATLAGGGIYNRSNQSIFGSTISGNNAKYGGGVQNLAGQLSIAASTITGNHATVTGGGVYVGAGSAISNNSIIAANTTGGLGPDLHPPSSGGTVVVTYSLIGSNVGTSLAAAPVGSPDANGNLIGTAANPINPLLGPLADNGGPTKTHALMPGSPALDAGDPSAVAGVGDVPPYDQRGAPFARVVDGNGNATPRIDMGSFESQGVLPALAGDYNGDGSVGAADYVLWRKTKGMTGVPAYSNADGNGDGVIDEADYDGWRANFGKTLPPGAASAPAAMMPPAAVSIPSHGSTLDTSPSPVVVEGPHDAPVAHGRRFVGPRLVAPATMATTPHDEALLAWLATGSGDLLADDVDRASTAGEATLEQSPALSLAIVDETFAACHEQLLAIGLRASAD